MRDVGGPDAEVDDLALEIGDRAARPGVRERDAGTYRDAAYTLAVGRVVEATEDRGIFP